MALLRHLARTRESLTRFQGSSGVKSGESRSESLPLVFAAILPFKNFVARYEAEETDGLFKAREDNNFFDRKAEEDAAENLIAATDAA